MLICFEGPQNSGKTTLINALLKERPDLKLWRRPEEIEDFKEKNLCWDLFVLDELSILNNINWNRNDMIVDRHPIISEWVYSHYFSRLSRVPKGDVSLLQTGCCFVYLQRNWRNTKKKLEQASYDAVMTFVKNCGFRVLALRTDTKSVPECALEIMLFIRGFDKGVESYFDAVAARFKKSKEIIG